MKILWFTWKDLKHPLAGGAEVVNEELAKRLVADGHEVTLLVGGFKGGEEKEVIDGYTVIRMGNRLTVYWEVFRYYKAHFQGWADLVIDEINTMPFFAKLYVKEKNIIFAHMLCRVIWFYQLPSFLGWIGYLLEPLYLKLLSDRKVITVSESSKKDLIAHGFKPENISIISEGTHIPILKDISSIKKFPYPTILSLGAIRPMKQTLDQIKAFEIAKKYIPHLKLVIAGDIEGKYGMDVVRYISHSRYQTSIVYVGKVNQREKASLMQRSHAIVVTSIKEGWGLVVTEAASQGTPAIVYDVDGLRDSVLHKRTGIVCTHNTPKAMATAICSLLGKPENYERYRQNAWQFSKNITFEQSYKDFVAVLESV